jgi:predicted nucleic acid-binding protein
MKILLDTSVFISLFAKDDHFESALSLFRSVLRGHEGAFCSMTMNELIWVLKRTGHDARFIREKVEFMFTTPLRFLPATRVVFAKSVELMQECNLDYGDAQIAAQAVVNAMDRIASFDTDFDRVTELERIVALSQAREV